RRLEEKRHLLHVRLDFANLLGRQKQQGAIPQRPQVHLVEQAIEVFRLLFDLGGELLQRLFHAGAVLALDDHHHVVIVAELINVLLPALKARLVGTDQVVALSLELEGGEIGVQGEGTRDKGDGEDERGSAGAGGGDAAEQARNQPGLFVAFRAHRVACLLAAREADSSSDDGTYKANGDCEGHVPKGSAGL